ncbi:BON domain-containing protein [Candidatus Laterigemmans baculatus]|uniref:BON domain-containing protein n=1 Tax=Candidatus Laterigemmans baculatus TaxID=2770505 RepID=UPI0013DB8DF8|nr:BON domain-containing protein [Candidatus Laterigemmans baculatus]
MSRSLPRLRFLALFGTAAVILVTAVPASAQQIPGRGGNGNGGEAGGGRGENGGGGNGGGGSGGGGTSGGGSGGSDGMASADEIFADGVQRNGAPEERGIGNAPETAGAGRGAGGFGGLGGFGGMGGFGGLGGFGGMNPFGGGQFGGANQQQRTVRTRLSSQVEVEPLPPRTVDATVTRRLATLYGNPRFGSVSLQMDGRTAILTGRVASEEDRRMARLAVMLEPGVSRVDNRLEVASQ